MPNQPYLKITKETGVFKPEEIDILAEVLDDFRKDPKSGYICLEETIDEKIAGFIIFGRTALTEFSWDIYWIVVDKNSQGRGIGKKLLKKAEEYISVHCKKAVLRVETSSKKEYFIARHFYLKQGFIEAGRIPDFYSQHDDLVIFYKGINWSLDKLT
jgi:ribosomal protein S18 acetylase RimI-like enzyme